MYYDSILWEITNMRIITIRLDENVLQEIDASRGSITRSDYIRNLLVFSLKYKDNINVSGENTGENTDVFHKNTEENTIDMLIETLQKERDYLKEKLDEALKLLHQEQVVHLQTQKLLPSQETLAKSKPWWQFWKK
jgi:hypothetical protein